MVESPAASGPGSAGSADGAGGEAQDRSAGAGAGHGAGQVTPGESPGAAPATQECPNCGTINPGTNLFCEGCGFDFTTGALPDRIPLADGTFVADPVTRAAPPVEKPGARVTGTVPPSAASPAGGAVRGPGVAPAVPPTSGPQPAVAPTFSVTDDDVDTHTDRPEHRPPSQRARSDWVVEVWIDPTWFALQDSEGESPSPGPPDIVMLSPSGAIIGRPSAARGLRPEVDCGTDTAVSRRHARLDTDGRRWWIEDLGSSNGTFVGGADQSPPEKPIAAGRRVEVDADDRIYVGAWTRLVVRPAADSDRGDLS